MHPTFTRGFRLHHNGRLLHGAQFPTGHVLVADDPQYGLATAAASLEDLLKGYHGARVEWPGDQLVPTALLLDLAHIAARVADSDDRARAVLAQLTRYLGYDVAERAAKQETARALARGDTHL
ncbi:hypothetical protein ACFOOM_12380 [Streptomyces echinoruber]|uniref:Uncharacterized protein n=1 Tax=Streptomyces echinoruber TaxID=68898 RepID=A0A918RL02_9ACTN|nr:hypothetical protein [Streptomyces echinoruber]GHA01139.1 hypothetical protein GCM10010389_45580 [Streptomyces echinoruber]